MEYALMPLLGSSFPLGSAASFVNAIERHDTRAIAQAELAYFTGNPEQAYNLAMPFLDSPQVDLSSSACLIVIYASLPLKKMNQANDGLAALEKQLAAASPNEQPMVRFACETAHLLLHLVSEDACCAIKLPPNVPVSEGVRLFSLYVAAHQAYVRGEYEFSMGLASGALAMASAVYPISFLYLYLIQCMCAISLKQPERARAIFRKAWDVARPDGLIQGIAEHHGLLGGLIESCIKQQDPKAYKDIISITYDFSKGWRMVHNPSTGDDVADNLSTTEFSIAMLINKGWSIREIAAHLGVSENTVKTHVKSIYKKLGIRSRKELARFMLR